ncbi:MAG TPA: PAS domain S-box protein [Dehalococcoidia bacterium]|nr:PAS domain S-box protein [Dehalococcoidia bacterium]
MKVLVAEGNEDSRNLLVKQLQVYGHEVIAVANGAEALEQAFKEKPDILVADILMPSMDGFQLCHLWKRDKQLRHIPFIFYTATYTSDEDEQFARSLGANAFIRRAARPDAFVQILSEIYEKAKSGLPSPPGVAPLEPSLYFAEYSKRLITMLDKKVAQLEREVAERKRAEEELRNSRYMLQTVLDSIPAAVFWKDRDSIYLGGNRTWLEVVGLKSSEEVVGKSDFDLPWEKEQADSFLEYDRRVMESGIPEYDIIEPYLRADDTQAWARTNKVPLRDTEGNVIGVLGTYEDITERKRAEEELKTKDDAIESSLSAIALSDIEGNLTYVNPSFLQMWGYVGDKEILGRPAIQFWQMEEQAAEIQKALLEKRDWFGELTARKADDSTFNAQISASLLTDGEGNPKGMVASFVDITERKRAEQTIRSERDRLQSLMDGLATIEIGIDIVGIDYKVLFQNETLQQRFGDLMGRLCYEAYMGLKKPCDPCPMIEAIKSKQIERVELLGVNGRYYEVVSAPLPDPDGRVLKAIEVVTDITERKRAEEELKDSEEKYRLLIDNLIEPLTAYDSNGRILLINVTGAKNLGSIPEDVVGKSLYDFFPDTADVYVERARRIFESGVRLEFEDEVPLPTGNRWFYSNIQPVKDTSGKVISVQNVSYDITERKRAEEALRESAERFRTLTEKSSDGITIIGADGNVLYESPSVERILGYGPDDWVGKPAFETIHPDDVSEAIKAYQFVVDNPGEAATVVIRSRHKNGSWHWMECIGRNLLEDSRVNGVVINYRDITERKQAEEERESAARRVEALRDVAQAVNRSLELDELLNESLATVLDVMQTDIGGIYLLDLQSGEFTLKAHIGVSEDAVGSIGLIKLKEKEIKRVLEWQEPVLTPFSLSTGANATRIAATIEKEGMRAHITVPIRSRDMPIGALLLADRRERQFSDDEVELLVGIGNEVAVGIENALLLQRTRELSLTDELTGLYNRRHFYHMLEPEMYRTLRKGRSFCLVMLDLDGFKEYNDRMGHASGDGVLQSFAQTVESSLRKSDTAFRYGGDEFIIILPETDANRARQIMDRIRARWLKLVEAQYAPLETPLGFSTGIAQFPENADKADGLVFLADSALYYAKKEGGGRDILVASLSAIPPEILGTATLDQVYALAATVDARDPYTYGHSGRVADIAQKIGRATGLSEKELANLYAASLLHDVGKVGVPDAILTKPGALTAEEWVAIKKHSSEGARIVGYVRGLGALVPVILHHHEWYDGTGYPDGLKGEGIPLAARIISVADAYDTMTTARPYREVVSHKEASEELRRCSGTQFDPELMEAFCRAMNGDNRQGKKGKPASE